MKTLKLFLISLIFTGAILVPSKAHAQLDGLPFGGLASIVVPCTCSVGLINWFMFTPLYLNVLPIGGPMAVLSTPTLYPAYEIKPASFVLGTYAPGVQSCWVGVEPFCIPLPVLGQVMPFTGSSAL